MIAIVECLAWVEPQRLQHVFADPSERLPIADFGLWLLTEHGENLGLSFGSSRVQLLFYVLIAQLK